MGEHKLPKKPNGETIFVPSMPEEVLRGMNHREWLLQFSEALLAQYRRPDGTTVPMTPFRAGAVSRLKLAAEYVKILETALANAVSNTERLLDEIRQRDMEKQHDP